MLERVEFWKVEVGANTKVNEDRLVTVEGFQSSLKMLEGLCCVGG